MLWKHAYSALRNLHGSEMRRTGCPVCPTTVRLGRKQNPDPTVPEAGSIAECSRTLTFLVRPITVCTLSEAWPGTSQGSGGLAGRLRSARVGVIEFRETWRSPRPFAHAVQDSSTGRSMAARRTSV